MSTDVRIWLDSGAEGADATDWLILSRVERERAMAAGAARPAFVRSRAFLRRVLAEELGHHDPGLVRLSSRCDHCGHPRHGKPKLVTGVTDRALLSFNLSHTRGLTVVAVAGAEVGVDAEHRSRSLDVDEIADIVLSAAERTRLEQAARHLRSDSLLDLWTKKEAFLKGIGRGLALEPSLVEVDPRGRVTVDRRNLPGTADWWVRSIDVGPDHSVAVSTTGGLPLVTVRGCEGQDTVVASC